MLDTTPSAIDEIPAADQPPVPAPVVPAKRKGPGALRGEVSLTLDTRQAVNLFNGRPKVEDGPHPIPGLYRFARCLDQIAVGGGAEDPYADWAIMRIEKLMTACEQLFTDLEADVRSKLESVRGIKIAVASSIDPTVVDLQLTSPYAHWGARLIGRYDALMAAVLSARHVALVDESFVVKTIQDCGTAFRRPVHVAQDYHFSGVTREDFEQKNARALGAVEKYGELPDEIITGAFRPQFRYQAKSH